MRMRLREGQSRFAGWLLFFGFVTGLGIIPGRTGAAEPVIMEDAASVPDAAPSPDSIRNMIQELESVRDYERLYWILHAIERQVPPARADLVKTLDSHVQQLIQAEVERRVPALLLTAPSSATSTSAVSRAPALTPARDDASPMPRKSKAFWVTESDYQEARRQVEGATLSSDPSERMQQTGRLTDLIVGVPDATRREELYQALQAKLKEEAIESMKTDPANDPLQLRVPPDPQNTRN